MEQQKAVLVIWPDERKRTIAARRPRESESPR